MLAKGRADFLHDSLCHCVIQRGRRAVIGAGSFGPSARPIQPSSITNWVISASFSLGSLTSRSGVSCQGAFFERAWEKIPHSANCEPAVNRFAHQVDHALAHQFGRPPLDLRFVERPDLEIVPFPRRLAELGEGERQHHLPVLAADDDRIALGKGDLHVVVFGVGGPRGGAIQPLGDVLREFGQREGAARQLQPLDAVVEHRFVDLQAGEAVGGGLGDAACGCPIGPRRPSAAAS